MDLVVPYEDEHLLVVDKPAGLVVHPAPGHARGTLVHGSARVRRRRRRRAGAARASCTGSTATPRGCSSSPARPKRTAGSRSSCSRARLTREYIALVAGRPRSLRGTIDAPIGRDRHDPLRHSLDTDTPRDAVTHFEVEELLPRHALLRVTLETGRTHQIRVHLAAIDLPVAGDPLYGRPGDLGLERQFLHAARLAFEHPFTGERGGRLARRCRPTSKPPWRAPR